MGRAHVEREGAVYFHAASFLLVVQNPEEELRPQLLDRFGSPQVAASRNPVRTEVRRSRRLKPIRRASPPSGDDAELVSDR